uniref:Uncharacterized protein n=1 Tax=Mycena chlorophos TaxID=658473 RepID=A0ABQ0LLT4_MYCCL|nr:predicted protein [Mycena chlorophos]
MAGNARGFSCLVPRRKRGKAKSELNSLMRAVQRVGSVVECIWRFCPDRRMLGRHCGRTIRPARLTSTYCCANSPATSSRGRRTTRYTLRSRTRKIS